MNTQQQTQVTAEARNPASCVTAGIASIPAPTWKMHFPKSLQSLRLRNHLLIMTNITYFSNYKCEIFKFLYVRFILNWNTMLKFRVLSLEWGELVRRSYSSTSNQKNSAGETTGLSLQRRLIKIRKQPLKLINIFTSSLLLINHRLLLKKASERLLINATTVPCPYNGSAQL